jgi:hypothetical protein
MSEKNPYERLGISEDASFDEIQEARNRLVSEHSGDLKVAESIEAAYDAILMDRLKMRQEGKIKVPDRIRFAERLNPALSEVPAPKGTNWLQSIAAPGSSDAVASAIVFIVLMILSVLANPDSALLQLLLALGAGSCLYFLNRKNGQFGRSLLIALGGLMLGLLLGTGLDYALANANVLSPGVASVRVDTLITLVVLWLLSLFWS